MPSFYPENNRSLPSDNEMRSLHKIVDLGGGGSGGSGGGGSGSGALQVYVDRAPADPDNVNIAALSYPSGGGPMQQWDVNSLSWL